MQATYTRTGNLLLGIGNLLAEQTNAWEACFHFSDEGSAASAVIPTFVVMGPLMLLVTLFPAVFGGLALFLRRWVVFLSVACLISSLLAIHLWFGASLRSSGWGSPAALGATITFLSVLGALWSTRRHRVRLRNGTDDVNPPGRGEQLVLGLCSLAGLVGIGYALVRGSGSVLLIFPWKVLLAVWFGLLIGSLYLMFLRRRDTQAGIGLPTEIVVLWAMAFSCSNLTALELGGFRGGMSSLPFAVNEGPTSETRVQLKGIAWIFDSGPGSIISSPLAIGDHVYVAAVQVSGFSTGGVVLCLQRETGELVWQFDDDGGMLQGFSSPCLADGRLYFGEGLHENRGCRLFCIDAVSGAKLWTFVTGSHTESSPSVVDGRVYFGAGDDGLYCLDAVTGRKLWQYQNGAHIDADPVVIGSRLYCGSGVSRTFQTMEIFCLNTADGSPIWRMPIDLPFWGSVQVQGDHVYYGLGNGRIGQRDEKPAGAVLCVEARTGRRIWKHDLPDAVLMRPEVDAHHVWVGCSDGHGYCLDRFEGRLRWRRPLDGPVVAAPVLARCDCCGAATSVVMIGSGGRVACLDPDNGDIQWKTDLGGSGWSAELFATPSVIVERTADGERRRFIIGAGMVNPITGSVGRVLCLEDHFSPLHHP